MSASASDTDFDLFPAAAVHARRLSARLVQARLAADRPQVEAYARVENAFDAELSGRGRLQHARTDGLCGSSPAPWRLASPLAGRRGGGPAPGRLAQPVHRRAAADARRAGADRVGDPSRAEAGRDAAVASRRGAIRSNDGSLLSVVGDAPRSGADDGRRRARPRCASPSGSGSRTLDLPFPQILADIEASVRDGRGRARARQRRARRCSRRIAALEADAPPRRPDTIWLGGGGRSVAATGLAARLDGAGRACASARCRATGSRSSNCWSRPPAILLRSDYRSGQYSGEQRWLGHPLARGARAARARSRPTAGAGPAWARCMIDEIARLRAEAAR